MADDRQPPPHVAAAAAIVDAWLKGAPSVTAGGANAPRPETAMQRFARLPRGDAPVPMPAWKDPRG
jgi:hypothetical protein